MNNNTRATFKSRLEEGTLIVRVGGQVTRETMKALRDEAFRWVVMTETKRLLCDMGATSIAMSEQDWRECAAEQASPHSMAIPTALLVPSSALSHAWSYSDKLNASGRACVAFRNEEDAYLWAGVPVHQAPPGRGTRAPRSGASASAKRRGSPGL